MFSRNMQHYRTAESLLPAIPVPGMHRGRLLCCQPLIPTLDPFIAFVPCCGDSSLQATGKDTIQMLLEVAASQTLLVSRLLLPRFSSQNSQR